MPFARIAGHVLLWCGFLAAAFVTVRSTEVAGDPWSTIAWPMYTTTLTVAAIGVVLLRMTARRGMGGPEQVIGTIEGLQENLKAVNGALFRFLESWSPEKVYDVHGWIDENLARDLAEFADARSALVREFGLRVYGQIMADFAGGERMINRAWCASADGYADEVEICLQRASSFLQNAAVRIDKLA